MATREYLSDVLTAVSVLKASIRGLDERLSLAMQRGEWTDPVWQAVAPEVQRLVRRFNTVADAINDAIPLSVARQDGGKPR